MLGPVGQRGIESDSTRQLERRYHAFDVLDDQVREKTLGRRQRVADLGGDHRFQGHLVDHFFQRGREVFDDDDGSRAGVRQLMLELARGIERIDVDRHHAGSQDANQSDRVLQQVGHHDRNAIALGKAQLVLEISRKAGRALV